MIPVTLQIKCDKFLKELSTKLVRDKELHLLIDIAKLEEYPQHITGIGSKKKYHFSYFILDTDEKRDRFFMEFDRFKVYYEDELRTRSIKISPLKIHSTIVGFGFNVTLERVDGFVYPYKVKRFLDKKDNKRDRRYYDHRSRS